MVSGKSSVGVTHYTASAHDDVTRVIESEPDLDFVQINYSVGEREAERRLLAVARDRGLAVIANRPFATGRLLQRLRGRPLPSWGAEIDCETWAQALLKFVISHPAITCAIPATSNSAPSRQHAGRLRPSPRRQAATADRRRRGCQRLNRKSVNSLAAAGRDQRASTAPRERRSPYL
jgi:diketogulonate reductase-like aldo/keto reductase